MFIRNSKHLVLLIQTELKRLLRRKRLLKSAIHKRTKKQLKLTKDL